MTDASATPTPPPKSRGNPHPVLNNNFLMVPVRDRYSPEEVIAMIRACKGVVTQVAKRLKCTPRTIDNYVARYPEVEEALDDERRGFVDLAELQLFKMVQDGEWEAVKFVLKTVGRHRGYIEREGQRDRDSATGGAGTTHTVPIIREVIVHMSTPPPTDVVDAELRPLTPHETTDD